MRWIQLTVPKRGIYGTVAAYHTGSRIRCMSSVANEPDELLEQVLEDERAAAVQEFREREEVAIDAADFDRQP
jgi:hypothetical protein